MPEQCSRRRASGPDALLDGHHVAYIGDDPYSRDACQPAGKTPLTFRLRTPRSDEAESLTELCLRSKAVWGYDEDFMGACRQELTLANPTMESSYLKVAEIGGHLAGVAQVTVTGEIADLDKLFVEPTRLRSGVGRALFEWAMTAARDGGAASIVIAADPNASGFYRRMGAVDDGTAVSGSIPGRLLPRLILRLSQTPAQPGL